MTNEQTEPDVNYDLFVPAQFSAALRQKVGRKFTFGPVEFSGLDKELDSEAARKLVVDTLEQSSTMKAVGQNLCVHGFKVQVKERTLKRSTSLLKHSRFLHNLEVVPVWPAEPEAAVDQ